MGLNIVNLEAQAITVNLTTPSDPTEILYQLRSNNSVIAEITSTDATNFFEATITGLELGGKPYEIFAHDIDGITYWGPLSFNSGYSIQIDANGGTGSFYDTAAYNSVYTLPSDGFWKYSSKLLGYSTNSDSTSAQFNVGMGIRMYQNWNLYCVWQEVTYTLSYYNTSGSSKPWMQETFTYDANGPYITVTTDIPERTGY